MIQPPPELRTDRLLLRAWRDADLDAGLAEMNADPDVMRFIADGTTRSREQSAAFVADQRRRWSEAGFGLFAVERAADGEFLGWAGLAVPEFLPEILPAVEIGWRLRREHWGHGYATEAARAVLPFAFRDVGLDRLVSIRHIDNEASARVMAKLGFTPVLRTVVPSHGRPVEVSALTRAESAAADGSA
ncbi:GNAT family N-acetyltransferase [Yinghuangia seranimata]|uniref:GNAT family N-acetyltransferase n=1 Tax=Yinghuangia seranimata TaxID=408067 RepID=UPI00248B9E46|nr:GNAT family N-acetyltransferase [Yinghuangia seranimata]MDI2125697.1 GNAT family N-acetyltransferase [Yinghuangia seranimata]